MVPDRQKVRMDRQTDGRRQNYIPPTLSGDNKKLVVRAGTHKLSVRIANKEDPNLTASEEAV